MLQERTYVVRPDWDAATQVRRLADLFKVKVTKLDAAARDFGRLEELRIAAWGTPRDLGRFWTRLDEVLDAGDPPRSSLATALRGLLLLWRAGSS